MTHPVKALRPGSAAFGRAKALTQCGECGRWWDDAVATAWTPAPSGRCPFEYSHKPAPRRADMLQGVKVMALSPAEARYLLEMVEACPPIKWPVYCRLNQIIRQYEIEANQ